MQNVARRLVLTQLRARTAKAAVRTMATQVGSLSSSSSPSDGRFWLAAAAGTVLGIAALQQQDNATTAMEKAPQRRGSQIHPNNYPPSRPDLPVYTMEEVAEHADEDSMWFTFRGGVYDMTPFAQGHPGGFPVSTITRSSTDW